MFKMVDDDGQVIAEGQVLSLKPGDILVFTTKQSITPDNKGAIKEALEGLFPDNKAAVLDDGDELNVLRQGVTA